MTQRAGLRRAFWAVLCLILCPVLSVSQARGEDDDLSSIELYNGGRVETVSAGRSPRPASQTAENITVVTAAEIEALNAHTLADVLFTVTGVQLEMLRTPGTLSNMEIQGANSNHVLVMIDNVPVNNLSDNFPDISSVPVQMIERVEIVKGAASSSWGSALGGVVNVITKSPLSERPLGGAVSVSLGKRDTLDGRAELSGTLNRFGYYLAGGKLRSDGLLPNNMVNLNSAYGKLQYELPVHGSLSLTAGLVQGSNGQLAVDPVNYNQGNRQLISTLSLQYPLAERFTLDATLRTRRTTTELFARGMADGAVLGQTKDEESGSGASLKLSWLGERQTVVGGVDYDHVSAHVSLPQVQADELNRATDRVGLYLNDTIELGRFAVTPSARLDHTGSAGELFSPSVGITYAVTENSILRGYTSRGYSLTSLNRSDSTEKVWTSQVGFESTDVPYLWLKGTLFRNDTSDINVQVRNPDRTVSVLKQRHLKQGYEFEARTLPFLGTSFSLGYILTDARYGESDRIIPGVARHTLNLGIKYEDSRYLRALLTGHYVDWRSDGADTPPPMRGKYDDVVWDLHLGKKIGYSKTGSVELFLSVRNLFNGDQYLNSVFKNPGRWTEGGVRCSF